MTVLPNSVRNRTRHLARGHVVLASAAADEPEAVRSMASRSMYVRLLTWSFTLFNTLRLFAYLPTLAAIQTSQDSSQHSLWTWGTWFGANLTMALWLYEQAGRRATRAAAVNLGNAVMCAAGVMLIVWYRF